MPLDHPPTPVTRNHGVAFTLQETLREPKVIEIVGTPPTECDYETKLLPSTSAASSLGVVERFRRDVAQKDNIDVTQINAEFKGSRAAQDMKVTTTKAELIFLSLLCS